MSISLVVAGLGGLAAVVATGLLVAKCLRAPSAALVAWTVAMFGLAISLITQASGHALGFGPVAFRGMELGAGIIAPLALVIGLVQIAGKSLPVRFAALLTLPALGFVALVILGSDPLALRPFSKAWPDPTHYYQIIPENLLAYLAPLVVLLSLIGFFVVVLRPRRDHAWQQAVPPAAAAAAAALVISVPGLGVLAVVRHHPVSLPIGNLYALLCIVAGTLTWFACQWAAQLPLDLLRYGAGRDEWDQQHAWKGRPDDTGGLAAADADGDPYGGLYRARDESRDYRDDSYAGQDFDSGFLPDGSYAGTGTGYGDTGYGETGRGFGPPAAAGPGGWHEGGAEVSPADLAGPDGYQGKRGSDNGSAGADLFGQIAIYTLLEERASAFDKLTRQVVKQVRENEPDTLVFIVHQVPSAPMQRILYEVYRDREAYEAHKRQPYLAKFEADRRPYVLATNVIELGLQQAKVSPLPSISTLLTDTGFDLLNDTGYGQPGYAPRPEGPDEPPAARGGSDVFAPGGGNGHRDSAGYDSAGYDSAGYDNAGYDSAGYDSAGYDSAGYDKQGHDAAAYDAAGYDAAGYDRPGYSGGRSRPGYGGAAGRDDWSEYGGTPAGKDRSGYAGTPAGELPGYEGSSGRGSRSRGPARDAGPGYAGPADGDLPGYEGSSGRRRKPGYGLSAPAGRPPERGGTQDDPAEFGDSEPGQPEYGSEPGGPGGYIGLPGDEPRPRGASAAGIPPEIHPR